MLLIGMTLTAFLLFSLVFYFFYHFQQALPYYRVDKRYCCFLLQHAIDGDLPCVDWYYFIGAQNLMSEELEQLRLACAEVDEEHTKASQLIQGKPCMQFTRQGVSVLTQLLRQIAP